MRLSSYNGNPYIGVYAVANEEISLVPLDCQDSLIDDIQTCLDVEVFRTSLASSTILGTLMALNSYGAVTSDMVSTSELKPLRGKVKFRRLKDRVNAFGNNILVNDNAALVNPDIDKSNLRTISDILNVEVVQGSLAGYNTVGSVCAVTNKGLICHPLTSKEEQEMLKSLFKVPVAVGTLNYGSRTVGASILANSKGAAVGCRSTPIEMGRVEDALYL